MTSFQIADEIMREPTACSNLSKYFARSRCESIYGQAGIPHSVEEDNLSPCDSKIDCLCQNIEINDNKHVCRQSQVLQPWKLADHRDGLLSWSFYLDLR